MNYEQLQKSLSAIILVLFALTATWAQDYDIPEANLPGENVILQWNRVLFDTLRTPGQQPPTIFPPRTTAIVHLAMFDAVNSIDGTYTPYAIDATESRRASREAAAAQAARDVMVALFPTRQAIYDAELASSLVGISGTRAEEGIAVGRAVATAILALRANDNWSVTPPAYILSTAPGNWQPTPANNAAATLTHYSGVLPFAIGSNSRFAPIAPPAMTSERYAADLNEVKEIGSVTSTTRTADQTRVAQLWAGVNTTTSLFNAWCNVARDVSISRNLSTAENARLFALISMSLHDTLLTTFTSKFVHGLWRPVTAIRRADEDNNPNTTADPSWLAFLSNPPYPAYAGNNAAVGTVHSTILSLFFGRDDIPFQHTWEGPGGMTRSYVGFTAMADEEANSRIFGGIHYRFDNVAGQSAGRNVATFVFHNFLRPSKCEL